MTVSAFKKRVAERLHAPGLQIALKRALPSLRERRAAAMATIDFEAARRELKAMKMDAIERLPALVQQFKAEAEKVGTTVHFADTPDDLNRIVGEIATQHQARLIVKGKSMVTEETHLNAYLEARGVTVVETDLGEWIIQLAHETPSHLIAPAIHKRREDVAALFSKALRRPVPDDIASLVATARQALREAFIKADIGITGVNVAIAETGGILLVENEGNGRLTSTLPPVHIACMGIEKIVPTMEDAFKVLQLLSKSGTGQIQTSYVNIITGTSRSADIEMTITPGVHGPKELHVILLDNNRSQMRDDPDFREALACIRCGACSNVCPPFEAVGGHVFGHVYSGAIGLVVTPFHHGMENAIGPNTLCVQCNACETVCPVGIPLPRQILEQRQRGVEQFGLPAWKHAMLNLWSSPERLFPLLSLAKIGQLPFAWGGFLRGIPAGYGRTLPALAAQPLRARLEGADGEMWQGGGVLELRPTAAGVEAKTVSFFATCLIDRIYPSMGEAIVQVLRRRGFAVRFARNQWCCGLVASNAGDRRNAQRMARHTIAALEGVSADYLVSGSASCTVAVTQDYPWLLRDDPRWQERAAHLADRMFSFATFLEKVLRPEPSWFAPRGGSVRVTYHDSCQSKNSLGIGPEPRRILTECLGYELVEMEEPAFCCGFGGTFSLEYPDVSGRILSWKLDHIQRTQAQVVVTDNPGCLMQLRGGIEAAGLAGKVRVAHLAELMAERLAAG
jgi:iron-sulfur cluster protein